MKLGPVRCLLNAGAKQSLCFVETALSLPYEPEQLQRIRFFGNLVTDLLTGFGCGLQFAALLQLDCALEISDEEMESRRAAMNAKGDTAWQPAKPRGRKVSAALQAYAAMATSAARGAVRDVTQLRRGEWRRRVRC